MSVVFARAGPYEAVEHREADAALVQLLLDLAGGHAQHALQLHEGADAELQGEVPVAYLEIPLPGFLVRDDRLLPKKRVLPEGRAACSL